MSENPEATTSRLIRIHPDDDVAVALVPLHAGSEVECGGIRLRLRDAVPAGHKVALHRLEEGARVHKYGHPIGRTSEIVETGAWIHEHNLKTELGEDLDYIWREGSRKRRVTLPSNAPPTFQGYRREEGRVATRNEIWVLNTVGCVNRSAERIARQANERFSAAVDGVHAFSHPFGCSQLGDDLAHTRRLLAALLRHPNAGGVLVLGLGCENNQLDALIADAEALGGPLDRRRLRFFNAQDVEDEIEDGLDAVAELVEVASQDARETCSASELILGLKCGGSDGLSGLTANPLVGRIADRLTAWGGGAVLTEVPEMFGAEQVLMERAVTRKVFEEIGFMVSRFKDYFRRHQQPIYENPSPGNKDGGLTTLEEKSLGAIQKGGGAPITQVLRYGQAAHLGGLSLLEAPGNDGVSSTALAAAGATLLLFTTGRGTPLGFPVPTIKITSNSDLALRKPRWTDFDAGRLVSAGQSLDELADELMTQILDIASGRRQTRNEEHDYREIAIWKEGVTL